MLKPLTAFRASIQSNLHMNFKRIIDTIKSYDFKSLDFRLIFFVIALSCLGIAVISSAASESMARKQVLGLIAGIIIMLVVSLIKYEFIIRYYWLLYVVNFLMLLSVKLFGVTWLGAQRWIAIGNFQFQPSELSKLLIIIFLAALCATNNQTIDSWKFFFFALIVFAIPLALIMLEPDLSTSIVIICIFCAIIFVSGLSIRIIKRVLTVIVPLAVVFIALIFILPADKNIIPEYQYNRLVGFYDKDNEVAARIRYQQENAVTAIAGGGLTGKGLNNDSPTSVKNANFISEPETDFIFTIIGEELGFVGTVATLLLISLIVFECLRIGYRAREQVGRSIAVGYGTMIAIQSFINIGVNTMIIPNTGLTLPFVSYGLSSLITSFIGIGIVLNVGLRKKISF